jgi:hypothetical protein
MNLIRIPPIFPAWRTPRPDRLFQSPIPCEKSWNPWALLRIDHDAEIPAGFYDSNLA